MSPQGTIFVASIAFGVIMAVRTEIKEYRWRRANPDKAARDEWKNS